MLNNKGHRVKSFFSVLLWSAIFSVLWAPGNGIQLWNISLMLQIGATHMGYEMLLSSIDRTDSVGYDIRNVHWHTPTFSISVGHSSPHSSPIPLSLLHTKDVPCP